MVKSEMRGEEVGGGGGGRGRREVRGKSPEGKGRRRGGWERGKKEREVSFVRERGRRDEVGDACFSSYRRELG